MISAKFRHIGLVYLFLFLLLLTFLLITLSNFTYPLSGDGEDHWNLAETIKSDESVVDYNVVFPKAPQGYPQGYHVLFVTFSNLTGIALQKVFLLLPSFLICFFFFSIAFLVYVLTKNNIIAYLSGFSLFFLWQISQRTGAVLIPYIYAMPDKLAIFLVFVFFGCLLKIKKRGFGLCILFAFVIPWIHRTTGIMLFGLVFMVLLFALFKKKNRNVLKNIFLLFVIFISISLFFVPLFWNYGLPNNLFKAQLAPRIISESSSSSLVFSDVVLDRLGSVVRVFDFQVSYFLISVWIIFALFGLIYLFKKKIITYEFLPFFLLIFIYFFNGLFLKIGIIEDTLYSIPLFSIFFLLFGIGFYFIFIHKKNVLLQLFGLIVSIFLVVFITSFIFSMNSPKVIGLLQSSNHFSISEEATSFLKSTSEDAVVIASPITSKTLATITRKDILHTAKNHYGLYVFGHGLYDIPLIHKQIEEIYVSCDFNRTKTLIQGFGESIYIYVGLLEKQYKTCFPKFETKHFVKKTFNEGEFVYYLREK